ncbi:SGNH/GDSL hydrolase family protein [Paenibacillus sp. MMS20-IR301]|uniref:SGNH/GDSL hydrolase family protein n=1 Tax=Paenibacillus sp. MMS20-IR301 TaxID=2895946 RepID=UPI0028E5741A|nr:SGNH/GDSL hydrolase family protein [Paenibacillus sp. MMS20-IR301]WNS46715.1 SGNH/GDSL hydrolase family protein [Paenibacillus sp. MMS20-IR301]
MAGELNSRGHPSLIPRRGLPGMRRRLAGNGPVTAAFLGGSITEGAGASEAEAMSWRALTGAYLQELYAGHPVRCINAGVGGTTSAFGAHRLQEHVLAEGRIDLLFAEFSVNDGEDRAESIRGMEGIVRQCRRLSPETELVFVYTAADKNLTGYKPFNIAVHEEVADYYGIPSIDCAAKVYTMIHTGELDWTRFAPDGYHPLDAGHALYAALVQEYLEQAITRGSVQASGEAAQHITGLPSPLDSGNYEYGGMLDYSAARYSAAFRFQKLKPEEPLMNWRFPAEHACTADPQAEFTFTVTGQCAGLVLLYGPDSGIIEYSLNGGPFAEINLFDDWCLNAYRPIPVLFPVRTEREILQVTVRNTERKDSRSTGNGLRVLKLLWN